MIIGRAPNLEVTWKYPMLVGAPPPPSPHVGPPAPASSNYAWVVMKTDATLALTQMGFAKPEARTVVEEAAKELPRDASLKDLMRTALRLTKR